MDDGRICIGLSLLVECSAGDAGAEKAPNSLAALGLRIGRAKAETSTDQVKRESHKLRHKYYMCR